MTEKRFKNVEENLEWGTVQYFTYYDEKITDKELEKLVNHLLNQNDKLNDENKQLKLQYKELEISLLNNQLAYNDLEKENEQLKDKYNEQSVQYEGLEEQVERLLDFKDNVFNLINAKIKEYKKYDGYDTEMYYIGTGLLKELKKEIRE